MDSGAWSAVDNDRYLTVPHQQGCVTQVGTKQLLDPDYRTTRRSKNINQLIGVDDQCCASIVRQSPEEVVLHVNDNETVARHAPTVPCPCLEMAANGRKATVAATRL